MRVLPVPEVGDLLERETDEPGHRPTRRSLGEPPGDRGVVGGRVGERGRGEALARVARTARRGRGAPRVRPDIATDPRRPPPTRSSSRPLGPSPVPRCRSSRSRRRRPAPEATVSRKGYRFTTTRSNGSIPCSASCARCSGLRLSASNPPWIRGCSVFTRPSSISGKPVTSSTGVTSTPASRRVAAVPPEDTSETPSSVEPPARARRCPSCRRPRAGLGAPPGRPSRRSSVDRHACGRRRGCGPRRGRRSRPARGGARPRARAPRANPSHRPRGPRWLPA